MKDKQDKKEPVKSTPPPVKRIHEQLRELSVNSRIDQLLAEARDAVFVAGRLALSGQITVIYAGPNVGKTLLSLHLISEAIAVNEVALHVYHINLDDDFLGLIKKAELGNYYGFKVIAPQDFPDPNKNFASLVELLIDDGAANETVLLLDTIKKFVDVMDKKASSAFMNTCRKFTAGGGTVIALAHTNKNKDADGKGIPAGTSDVLDDCDCAYVLNLIEQEKVPGGTRRTVEFLNQKARGPVTNSAIYSYTRCDEADYDRIFNSIRQLEGDEADEARARKAMLAERLQDDLLITAISDLLSDQGPLVQGDIVTATAKDSEHSRRKIISCLNRWEKPADQGGVWGFQRIHNNAKRYVLHSQNEDSEKPSEEPQPQQESKRTRSLFHPQGDEEDD